MSLTSTLSKVPQFKEIVSTIAPKKKDFKTASGKNPFSKEYETLVPYTLEKPSDASLIGTAFDYLARFRIAQIINLEMSFKELVAYNGLKKLQKFTGDKSLEDKYYSTIQKDIDTFIKDEQSLNNEACVTALMLANLERYSRANMLSGVSETDIFDIQRKDILTNELTGLMETFEEKFINCGFVKTDSKVVFNPHFGIASLLVDGADADILIDDVLYDFKVVKDVGYKSADVLQLTGYFLLNQLLKEIEHSYSVSNSLPFDDIEFSEICLYKARFGECEYFDFNDINGQDIRDALIRLAEYFLNNPDKTVKYTFLKAHPDYDLTGYDDALRSIANSN
ncbi:hypothetical protein AB0R69_15575 [Bacillus pumilus]|uniref:hypothetical protein n=1 Tax=Bacillus pumilus TaxID=1408 RepID=UPI0034516B0E